MSRVVAVPLGAGQEVGRSCVLVTVGGKRIMFDCGMHNAYHDHRRFPDFSQLGPPGRLTEAVDCVVITHFHLDHVGALPHFTEVCGYNGPIYMTHPTRAVCPVLLHDYRHVMVSRKGARDFYTESHIAACMAKVRTIALEETLMVDEELQLTAYYAGHVLGAVIVHAVCNGQSVVYTGDFNATADRHLSAARIGTLRPDLLITESTYATSVRDVNHKHEKDFLSRVDAVVSAGGKVLIPVFAFGRAQELQLLLETHWEERGLEVPIYFSSGLVHKANLYYRLFSSWTNQSTQAALGGRSAFDFRHVKPYPGREALDAAGAVVLFATPGMLYAGVALEAFKAWADDAKNLVLLPSYCVPGTVGQQLLQGRSEVILSDGSRLDVRCKAASISFSAHADSKGLMWMISTVKPRAVMLVHGEKYKMTQFKSRISRQYGLPCFDPENGVRVTVEAEPQIRVLLSEALCDSERLSSALTTMPADVADAALPDADALGVGVALGGWGGEGADLGRQASDGDGGGDGTPAAECAAAGRPSPSAHGECAGSALKRQRLAPAPELAPGDAPTADFGDHSVTSSLLAGHEQEARRLPVSGVLMVLPEVEARPGGQGYERGEGTAASESSGSLGNDSSLRSTRRVPRVQLVTPVEAAAAAGLKPHVLRSVLRLPFPPFAWAEGLLPPRTPEGARELLGRLWNELEPEVQEDGIEWVEADGVIASNSVRLTLPLGWSHVRCEWCNEDEALVEGVVTALQSIG